MDDLYRRTVELVDKPEPPAPAAKSEHDAEPLFARVRERTEELMYVEREHGGGDTPLVHLSVKLDALISILGDHEEKSGHEAEQEERRSNDQSHRLTLASHYMAFKTPQLESVLHLVLDYLRAEMAERKAGR